MQELTKEDRIHHVIEHMVGGPKSKDETVFRDLGQLYSIPTDGPAKHATFKEFSADEAANMAIMKAVGKLSKTLRNVSDDQKARFDSRAFRWALEQDDFTSARVCAIDGLVDAERSLLKVLYWAYVGELGMLHRERAKWWAQKGRKRNLRAYAIAKHLADTYVLYRKEKPTYGVNYGVPTGRYSKALDEIFVICDLKLRTIRGPAEAAIKSLSESYIENVKRGQRNFLSALG